jgi:hypothetical protein
MPVFSADAVADLKEVRDRINAEVTAADPTQKALNQATTLAFLNAHTNMRTMKQLLEVVVRMNKSQHKPTMDGIRAHEWRSFIELLTAHIGDGHPSITDVLLRSMQSHLARERDKGIDAVFRCNGLGPAYAKDAPAHIRYPTRESLWEDGIARNGEPAYPFARRVIRDYFLHALGDSDPFEHELSVELIAIELVDGNELNPYDPSSTSSTFPVHYTRDIEEQNPADEGDRESEEGYVAAAPVPYEAGKDHPSTTDASQPMELDDGGSQEGYTPVPNVNMLEQNAFRQQAMAKRAEFDRAQKTAHEVAAAARLAEQKKAEDMTMRNQQKLLQLRQSKRDREAQANQQKAEEDAKRQADQQKEREDARLSQERQAELARQLKRNLEAESRQRALEKDADAIRARAEQRMQNFQQSKATEEYLRKTTLLPKKPSQPSQQQKKNADRLEQERRLQEQTSEQWRQATELVQRQLKRKRDEEERARMGAAAAASSSSSAAAAAASTGEVKVEQFRPREKDMPFLTAMDTTAENACMMIIYLPCRVTGSDVIHTVSTSISIADPDDVEYIMKLVHKGSAVAKTKLVELGIIPEHGIDVVTTHELHARHSDAVSASYRLVKYRDVVRTGIVTRQSFPVEAEPYHGKKDLCVQTIQSLVVFDSLSEQKRYKPTAQNLLICKLPARDGQFQYDDSKTSVVWLATLPKRLVQTNINPFFRSWNFQIHRERPMDDWQTNKTDIQNSMRSIFRAIACVLAYDGPCYLICRIPQQLLGRDGERITAEFTVALGTRKNDAYFLMHALESALDYRKWKKTPISQEIPDAAWFCFIACKARMPAEAKDDPSQAYHWNTRFQKTFAASGDTTVDTDFRMSNKAPSSDYSFLDNIVRKALREAGAGGAAQQQPVDYTGRRDNNPRWPFDVYFANSYTLEKVYEVLTKEYKQAPSLRERPFLAFIERLRSRWFVQDW